MHDEAMANAMFSWIRNDYGEDVAVRWRQRLGETAWEEGNWGLQALEETLNERDEPRIEAAKRFLQMGFTS